MAENFKHLKVEESALIQAMLELNSEGLHQGRAGGADARRRLILPGFCRT